MVTHNTQVRRPSIWSTLKAINIGLHLNRKKNFTKASIIILKKLLIFISVINKQMVVVQWKRVNFSIGRFKWGGFSLVSPSSSASMSCIYLLPLFPPIIYLMADFNIRFLRKNVLISFFPFFFIVLLFRHLQLFLNTLQWHSNICPFLYRSTLSSQSSAIFPS